MASRREKVKRLQKRADWLKKRIAESEGLQDLSYDKAELGALEWAIEMLENFLAAEAAK